MPDRILISLIVALAQLGCATNTPANVVPVTNFDVNRYLGTWYEIARLDHSFERGLSRVTAEYSLREHGSLKVLNKGYNVEQRKSKTAEGKAKFRGDETVGSLKVSFFGPYYGGYHIIELDDDYQYALVAGPSKNYLWILARSPELDGETYKLLVSKAADLGFPTEELIRVNHEGGN